MASRAKKRVVAVAAHRTLPSEKEIEGRIDAVVSAADLAKEARAVLALLRKPETWMRVTVQRGGVDGGAQYYLNGDRAELLRREIIESFERELREALAILGA